MKMLFKMAIALILIFIAIIALAWLFQTRLIFFPSRLPSDHIFRNDLQHEEVFLTTSDSVSINALFFPSAGNKVILYLHGNAGCLDSWQYAWDDFRMPEYNFLIIDYRGYGKSTGRISEDGFYTDAQSAYDYLLKRGFLPENIVVYGRSIGSGVAVHLASTNPIGALILEAPYTSVRKLASEKAPLLLPWLYIKYRFDNLGKINAVKAPLLVIHGTGDNTIPFVHGQSLFESFNGKKTMLTIEGGNHNNLAEFREFGDGIKAFLTKVGN
jgi:fermentation-respiration switch protein FrsA (DUF1100 family)